MACQGGSSLQELPFRLGLRLGSDKLNGIALSRVRRSALVVPKHTMPVREGQHAAAVALGKSDLQQSQFRQLSRLHKVINPPNFRGIFWRLWVPQAASLSKFFELRGVTPP